MTPSARRAAYVAMLERMLESGRQVLAQSTTARDRRYAQASVDRLSEQLAAARAAQVPA